MKVTTVLMRTLHREDVSVVLMMTTESRPRRIFIGPGERAVRPSLSRPPAVAPNRMVIGVGRENDLDVWPASAPEKAMRNALLISEREDHSARIRSAEIALCPDAPIPSRFQVTSPRLSPTRRRTRPGESLRAVQCVGPSRMQPLHPGLQPVESRPTRLAAGLLLEAHARVTTAPASTTNPFIQNFSHDFAGGGPGSL